MKLSLITSRLFIIPHSQHYFIHIPTCIPNRLNHLVLTPLYQLDTIITLVEHSVNGQSLKIFYSDIDAIDSSNWNVFISPTIASRSTQSDGLA